MLNCPVLFIAFKRPKETKKILKIILNQKPSKLYIFQDGPKKEFSREDLINYQKTHEAIQSLSNKKNITNFFFKKNIGPISIGDKILRRIFKREKKIIVIEDDTVPKKKIFSFCDILLRKYAKEKKICQISGCNLVNGTNQKLKSIKEDSYFFSKYPHLWGWATWKDRWIGQYDLKMRDWEKNKNIFFNLKTLNTNEKKYFKHIFGRTLKGKEPWDMPWLYLNLLKSRLTIVPKVNQIRNIGYKENPTGKSAKKFRNLTYSNINFPLKFPKKIKQNLEYDEFLHKSFYNRKNIFIRFFEKVKKKIK